MILDLLHNVAVLVALSVGVQALARRVDADSPLYGIATGLLFGMAGIVGMSTPMTFAPGVIYDGRSIVLSLAGLFGGPLAAALGGGLCAAYRFYLGGAGVWAGVGTVVEASVLGICLHYLRRRDEGWASPFWLLTFGLFVHAGMLALQFLIPGMGWEILRRVGPAVLVFYPIGFLLTAQVFLDGERRRKAEKSLRESEERYRAVVEDTPVLICRYLPGGEITYVNEAFCRYFGRTAEDVAGQSVFSLAVEGERERMMADIAALNVASSTLSQDYQVLAPGGEPRWERWTCRALFGPQGQAVAYQAVGEDITRRKLAEEALQRSESLHVLARRASGLGIWEWNITEKKVYWTPEVEAIFGYEPGETNGVLEDVTSRIHPEDVDGWRESVEASVEEGKEHRLDFRVIWPDQSVHWVFVLGDAERDTSGKATRMVGIVTDITERKQAEVALRSSERFLNSVFEAIREGISVLDLDLSIVRVNKWIEEKYSPQAVLYGKKCYAAYQQRDAVCPWCPSLKAIETGETQIAEVPYAATQGQNGWLELSAFPLKDEHGKVTGVIECVRDLTERKLAEAERERLMSAIEQAAEVVVITDREGAIQYVNPAFERVTGYTREEALGRNPRILKSGEHDAAFYRNLWDRLVQGQPWTGHFSNKKKDGTLYQEEATISPVRDATGQVTNYVAVKRDVTHEQELEEQLLRSQKMEAIGQLAGGVAHDFNNILQAMLGHLAFAMERAAPGAPIREDLQQVRSGAERAAELTRQLLAFGRQQVLQPKDIDLNQVVGGVLRMVERVIGEDIQLDFIPGHQLGTVLADPSQLEQVIMNLCINARDAMPQGGKLTVKTQNVVLDSAYCEMHPWAKPGRFALLKVADTGTGMDEETQRRAFEPFFTTKELGKGTGLGLATAYGIVKQHDGLIQVYSGPGRGSLFKVYLPAATRAAGQVERESEGPVGGGTETILVAEDDDVIRGLAVRVLEKAGYTVLEASNGEEAVEVFRAHSGEIDLALFDVVMPKMSGPAAYDALRTMGPQLRVLFSSGYSANSDLTRFSLDEGVELIQKPYEPKALLRKVREILDAPPAS